MRNSVFSDLESKIKQRQLKDPYFLSHLNVGDLKDIFINCPFLLLLLRSHLMVPQTLDLRGREQ